MAAFGAKTWVEIDTRALQKNLATITGLLSPGCQPCPTIKANAYGHDLKVIAESLSGFGVRNFGVDSVDEAIMVRRLVPEAEIFILGYTVPEHLGEVVGGGLIQTVYDLETLHLLIELAKQKQIPARINIKIETGTGRQGIKERQLAEMIQVIKNNYLHIQWQGISSHFAEAEKIEDQSFTREQQQRFSSIVASLQAAELAPPYIHISCSAAAMLHPDSHFTVSRFGISLYGLWPSDGVKSQMRLKGIELHPVLSWKTRVAQVKDLSAGDTVGYDRTFRADRPMRIAVLPVGYFDGYRRSLNNRGSVIIRGARCPVVGNICMNMCMVDISNAPQTKIGDTVTLIGRDGMNQITADDLAVLYGTINYEVVTTINPLLPRVTV